MYKYTIQLVVFFTSFILVSSCEDAGNSKDIIYVETATGESTNFTKKIIYKLGKYTIIEYPESPDQVIEFKLNNKTLFIKDGSNSSIFHEKFNVPVVILQDTNNDGLSDRLIYDVYDKRGQLVSTSTDLNLDGQIDTKLLADGDIQFLVWINNKWTKVKEFGRDSTGKIIQKINVEGEWKIINRNNYPFVIED